ncbi:hypothetical protein N9N32_00015 [Alphaproteobacteria bacterium]|nr:hypothetical protein [Alphaproteobacteria bacterium]
MSTVKVSANSGGSIKASLKSASCSSKVNISQKDIKATLDQSPNKMSMSGITDTAIGSVQDGDVLIYEEDTSKWENHQLTTSKVLDIDNTNKSNGALLVYQTSNSKYTATTTLDNPDTSINGGSF